MEWIEENCKSDEWDASKIENLSLTGLQPCFEDVVLLGTVHLGFLILGGVRLIQVNIVVTGILFSFVEIRKREKGNRRNRLLKLFPIL